MNKLRIGTLILLLTVGCKSLPVKNGDNNKSFVSEQKELNLRNTIFTSKSNEDNLDLGSGNYTCPINDSFKKGMFKISEFKIEESSQDYYFIIKMAEDFDNEWDMPKGFSKQMFDIYFNLGKGEHHHCLAGRNVKITEGWDKAILVTPVRTARAKSEVMSKNRYICDDASEMENLTKSIVIAENFEVKENVLTVKISKQFLNLKDLKGVQLFSMALDTNIGKNEFQNMLVREVKVNATQWYFGGGTASRFNPNVLDILGSNEMLKNFSKDGNYKEFASINLIKIEKEGL